MNYFKTFILVLIALIISCLNAYAQTQIGQDIDGEAAENYSGWSVSMSDASAVAIGAPYGANGTIAGHVRVFEWNGSDWVQKGVDIYGEAAGDKSGSSVSMPDTNTVAIGAIWNDGNGSNAGHVRVYEWNGSSWVQKGIDIDGEAAGDQSSYSVSMPDANTVAIGAPYNDGNGTDAGHVRVYEWNGSSWVQKGIDIDGEAAYDQLGQSVSMPNANTVAIGAPYNDANGIDAGRVRVYEWNGSSWVQKGIDIDGETVGDEAGFSVSMPDTNTVAIGARKNDGNGTDAGHVRVYDWNGSSWVQKGIDIDGEAAGDQSGFFVSMPDANIVAIGAPYNDENGTDAGHVRVYDWNGSIWEQKGMDIDGEALGDWSGASVSMPDSNTVAIGAMNNDGNGFNAGHVRLFKIRGVNGKVYNDINQNCVLDELGVVEGILGIIQPGNIIFETASNGAWYIDSLPIGNYTVTFDTTGNWLASCSNFVSFIVTNPDELTQAPDFGMFNVNPCSEPTVSIHMPFMRPGFSNQTVYVSACNTTTATGALNNASVVVTLDSLITVDATSLTCTNLANNTFSFDIGNLNPGECIDFSLSTTLSTSAILGQTLCMEASLLPVDSCALDTLPAPTPPDFTPCSLPWDKSSILVEGECINDSIVFTITNTGDPGNGDMDCYSPVRLYIDGVYIWLDSIQLLGGESFVYSYAGDGRTWHLEVDQHPLHPGNSNPNATIELCGNQSNWTPNLVNIFPQDDLDPVKDIYCSIVKASYDPNDKTGFPLGVGTNNLIAPNGKLDYVIRFQNTGTDTAFTVVIRDTLDFDLDIFSVQSGVASHAYSFQMHGPRVLEWTFNNILLPDSTTNEPESNGFVTFTVDQMPNLPDGTEINNKAGIYFDSNPPIITFSTSHIIGSEIQMSSWTEQINFTDTACAEYLYNGVVYTQTGNYYQVIEGIPSDTLVTLDLTINTVDNGASLIDTLNFQASAIGAQYQWVDCNNNFAWISGETNQNFTASMNGSYSVIVTENGCTDTSACITSIFESDLEGLTLYPNPTSGKLTIDLGNLYSNIVLRQTNILGQLIKEESFDSGQYIETTIEGVSGTYQLEIFIKDERKALVSVLKQ